MWAIILMQIVGTLFEALGRMIGGLVGGFIAFLHLVAGTFLALGWIPYSFGVAVMKAVDLFLGFLS